MSPTPASISIGEIHVPGSGTLQNARTFLLTAPASASGQPELLFGLFSADAPRKVVEKLCDRIIEEVRPAFFPSGDETRFEAALSQVNRVILGFLYDHGLSMHGIRLRGMLGGLSGDRLYIANRGDLKGMLLVPQRGTLTPYTLFEEAGARTNDPKFFSSLQAGRLPAGARLIATTGELFKALDEAYVRDLFIRNDAEGGVRSLKNALRTSRLPVAALTLSIPSTKAAAPENRQAPEAGRKPQDEARPQAAPARAAKAPPTPPTDFGEMAARGLRAGAELTVRGLMALVRLIGRTLLTVARIPLFLMRTIMALADSQARARLAVACREAPERCVSAVIGRLNAVPVGSRVQLFLLLACGTIFLHGLLFSFRHQLIVHEVKAYEAQLAELQRMQTDFEAGLIYADDRRSRELLAQMSALASALPAETEAQTRAKDDAAATIEKDRDRLRRLSPLSGLKVVADLGDRPGYEDGILARFGDVTYLFSRSSPSVLALTADGPVETTLEGVTGGAAAAAAARTGLLFSDAEGRVRYWKPDGSATVEYPDVRLDPPSPILFYESRLYAADKDGTVSRRQVAARSLGAASPALQGLASTPVSIVADGALYVLASDGAVKKYVKNALDPQFAPPAMDPPLTAASLSLGPEQIAFVAAGGDRIILLDKRNGRLIAQLTSPELAGLVSMAVRGDGKAAYVLAGAKVLEVPLETPVK